MTNENKRDDLTRRSALRGLTAGIGAVSGIGFGSGVGSAGPDRTGPNVDLSNCSSRGYYLTYLDGICHPGSDRYKTYPDPDDYSGDFREWQSPIRDGAIPAGYYRPFASVNTAAHLADTEALNDLGIPDGMRVSVINVKRDENGVPYYRYFANMLGNRGPDGRDRSADSVEVAYEPWSASKVFGIAAAAAKIRRASDNETGLDSKFDGRHTGEAITDVVSYRNGVMTSNRLSAHFLETAGHGYASNLFEEWIGSLDSSMNGGYGADPGRYDWRGNTHAFYDDDTGERVTIDGSSPTGDKEMTPLAMSEFLKRLVMHREDPATRLPGFRSDANHQDYWEDLKMLFYGAPWDTQGGMLDDTAIYLESAVDFDTVSSGDWRIFSKLGYSGGSRGAGGEFVYTGYAALPRADDPTSGSEFFITVHFNRHANYGTKHDKDEVLQQTIEKIVNAVRSGRIDHRASTPSTEPHRDITYHWAEDELETLINDGTLSGYADGTIRPDTTATRAEAAALIVSAFDPKPEASKTFPDIEGHWAKNTIETAAGAGFFSGDTNGKFNPEQPITKTEILVSLVAGVDGLEGSLGRGESPVDYLGQFEDGDAVPWGREKVAAAVKQGLVPDPDGSKPGWYGNVNRFPWYLEPDADATRAEVLYAIHEALYGRSIQSTVFGEAFGTLFDGETSVE
jgi:hypothetical protein